MYYFDKRLQYPVRVEKPDPIFARQLQQAIGGVEGEIRVCLQYFFQAWGARGPAKYRDVLLNTATEEISHIEMLSTAVALNLENAPATMQETSLQGNPIVGAVMSGGERPRHVIEGMLHRHILSTGMAALPADCDGTPFDCSHVYASGNLAADMYCNVAAEATGRTLAVRLYNSTSDPGMQDMLSYLIARDTMHQQQWLAVIEEMGGDASLPIPNSFDRSKEATEFSYMFMGTERNGAPVEPGRYSEGPSLDGRGEFSARPGFEPLGDEPVLGPARPDSAAQVEQMQEPPVTNALT
ncbi:manganese catalase family protein [Bradyrhizobium sp. 199]|uniref:manganese catalase family protein n=1 Tax=Bradyrhizobium sp. 199 TaxID=2782664 RepID=UPI001FFC18A2|nr:manganese catalase family protein [Bradyrhizobium sp. 199]MCK1359664.1 manganese catalase family protein [Bradyrhizobium sp. 199]